MPRLARLIAPFVAALLPGVAGRSKPAWLVDFAEKDGTRLSIRMTLVLESDHWELYSSRGGVNQLINWRQRLLGRLTGKLPPKGALIYGSGQSMQVGDSTILRGGLASEFLGQRYLRASLRGDRLRGTLAYQSDTNRVGGTIDGLPVTSDSPVRNYRAIAASTRDSISALIFDPRIPARPNILEFFRRFDAAAARATDDLDIVAAFISLEPLLGISHFAFIRNPQIAATPLDLLIAGDRSVNPGQWVNASFYGNGALCYLRVSRWDRATPFIHRAFQRMDSVGTKVLVIDITFNGGGDATSFVPAMYLFRDTIIAGGVVGRVWNSAHSSPPADTEMARFRSLGSEEEAKTLLDVVRREDGALARFAPRQPYFGGKVYLLVNGFSASASEPLAHLLKSTARAQLIGRRTAGRMLTALPHHVGDGFIVTVPEADYYAKGTVRLEGRGVEPDIDTDDPNIVVGRELQKSMPYPALLLMAQTHFNRREYAQAERDWTQALALAPTDANKRAVQDRIDDVRRRLNQP